MVGGGGLLTVPALFSAYPAAPPVLLLGTNKCASVAGTSVAAWRYSRRIRLDWAWLAPATLIAFASAALGAWTLTWLDPAFLRKGLPWVLMMVLLYTLTYPQFGLQSSLTSHPTRLRLWRALAIGALVGWYDGFFGPGTGSFFIFLLVRWLGQDFLQASASAKVLNVSTNLAALLMLSAAGQVWWQVGLAMALANIAGSLLGTMLAFKHGAALIRRVFIVVVIILIVKTGLDGYASTTFF